MRRHSFQPRLGSILEAGILLLRRYVASDLHFLPYPSIWGNHLTLITAHENYTVDRVFNPRTWLLLV